MTLPGKWVIPPPRKTLVVGVAAAVAVAPVLRPGGILAGEDVRGEFEFQSAPRYYPGQNKNKIMTKDQRKEENAKARSDKWIAAAVADECQNDEFEMPSNDMGLKPLADGEGWPKETPLSLPCAPATAPESVPAVNSPGAGENAPSVPQVAPVAVY